MPLKFRKVLIADERYESAGVLDVNGDGHPDVVSGAWWYEGPDFTKQHHVCDVLASGEYFDDFATIPLDVNGNGRLDYVTGGWFSRALKWRENPGDPGQDWPEHTIAEPGHVETARGWDLDGDGVVEIVPNTPQEPVVVYKLVTDADGRGTGEFAAHQLHDQPQGHGMGYGDIAGNGRMDLVLTNGWLEAPADPWQGPWAWHPEFELCKGASVPILVADVNGNGLADLIVGAGHGYGLWWWEQHRDGDRREWVPHAIDLYNSQYHDMQWVDLDGDGQCELVTGKRYRAHCGHDPGADDDVGLYYFKWTGEAFAKQIIDYGPTRVGTGIGLDFQIADLTGDGRLDIVAPGKDGLYVFFNEG